ncbi:hypothetical protein FQR65_LT03034 [Abscondita terminalis]|nr:hypothetical protein FQR65_LT03034 [Abscondita terminalis]
MWNYAEYCFIGLLALIIVLIFCIYRFFLRNFVNKLASSPLIPTKQFDINVNIPTCYFPNALASLPVEGNQKFVR